MARRDAVERFSAAAADLGVEVAAVRYPEGTRTAVEAAAAIGCSVAQIVKSLVFATDHGVVLALTAGSNLVDTDALAALVGAPVRRATPDQARAATGFAIGGTPPFGHPRPVPTHLDEDLLGHDVVWAAAGAPDACFPIAPERLAAVTGATPARFGRPA